MKNIPAVTSLVGKIERLKQVLEAMSTKIERQLQAGGPAPRPTPAPSPRPEPTGTGPRGEPEF